MKTCLNLLMITFASIGLQAQNVGIGIDTPFAKLHIMGDSSSLSEVLRVQTTYTGESDIPAIYGYSAPAPGWGLGGKLQGGYIGLQAQALAEDYTGGAYGVVGESIGTSGTGLRVGVYGWANGGAKNLAAYLDGSVYIRDSLGIGIDDPLEVLDLGGAIRLGTTTGNHEGVIRYADGLFQGNITGTPSGWKTFNGPWAKDMNGNYFLSPAIGSKTMAIGDSMLSTNMKLSVRWDIPSVGGGGVHGMATKNGFTVAEGRLGYQYGNAIPTFVSNIGVLGTVHHDSITTHESFGVAGNNLERDSCNYGVYGIAQGLGQKNIGVYGFAQNGQDNWAGYFDGNMHVKERLLVGTEVPKATLHVGEGHTVLFGKDTIGDGTVGSKLFFLPWNGGAFRAGLLSYDGSVGNGTVFWDPDNVGWASVAIGNNTKASGSGSIAIGIRSNATNFGSVALGHLSRTTGNSAVAAGYYAHADAFVGIAVGPGNVGGGNASVWIATDPIFEVGNSTDTSNRHNALTILKNGKVGIDTHTPSTSLHIKQLTSFSDGGIRLEYDSDSDYWETWIDGANDYNFGFNGLLKGYILDTDGSYVAVSDRRLKTNIRRMEPVLSSVRALKPSTYQFIANDPESPLSIGFIAQEVEELFPEVVHSKDGYLGVNYSAFAVIAIQAIKELADENDELKNSIESYEDQISKLQSQMDDMNVQISRILEDN